MHQVSASFYRRRADRADWRPETLDDAVDRRFRRQLDTLILARDDKVNSQAVIQRSAFPRNRAEVSFPYFGAQFFAVREYDKVVDPYCYKDKFVTPASDENRFVLLAASAVALTLIFVSKQSFSEL